MGLPRDALRGKGVAGAHFDHVAHSRPQSRAKHLPRFIFSVLPLFSLSKFFHLVTFVFMSSHKISQLMVTVIDFLIH